MRIMLHHPTGLSKPAKYGFSWTMFFFGGLVPLSRGDLKWFFINWLFTIPTLGMSKFVMPFIYNKIYITEQIEKGWIVEQLPPPTDREIKEKRQLILQTVLILFGTFLFLLGAYPSSLLFVSLGFILSPIGPKTPEIQAWRTGSH